QLVSAGSVVTPDGTRSSDPDGDALTYEWTLTSRPGDSGAVLAGETTPSPTFAADACGAYTATLVVRDGRSASDPASVRVVVNCAPVANAGANQTVAVG